MTWLSGLSSGDKEEMAKDSCDAFNDGKISEGELRLSLGSLGYNATDIEDLIKFYRPEPPENDNGDAD